MLGDWAHDQTLRFVLIVCECIRVNSLSLLLKKDVFNGY